VIDVAGCWRTAEREINKWIMVDINHEADGLTGDLMHLGGWEKWTDTPTNCLNITDMDDKIEEADADLDLEGGGDGDEGGDSDSSDGDGEEA